MRLKMLLTQGLDAEIWLIADHVVNEVDAGVGQTRQQVIAIVTSNIRSAAWPNINSIVYSQGGH